MTIQISAFWSKFTKRIVSVLKGVDSAAGAEKLDGRLDVVVAVHHVHHAALEQPVNRDRPSGQTSDLRETGFGVPEILERVDMSHRALLDDSHGMVEVSSVVVHLFDDRDQTVVPPSDEDLSGVDGHDVRVLQAVLVDHPHALVVTEVLLAQDRTVVTSEGRLVSQVISGDGGRKGFTLGQLLFGQDAEHDVLGISRQLEAVFDFRPLPLFRLSENLSENEKHSEEAKPQSSALHLFKLYQLSFFLK